jgi:beta-1,4-mannosyl-glycoprotein beta-1,4-N-acetylglucosaminyltransferase
VGEKPLIWDMVPFFNELEILELRLETLDPVVDKFVICEATTTHSGKPKPLLLQENGHRFARWAHKIKHVVVELGQTTDWGREKEQRVCLWHGFSGHPSDLIILSDVDEIPNPEAVGAAEEIMSGVMFLRSSRRQHPPLPHARRQAELALEDPGP